MIFTLENEQQLASHGLYAGIRAAVGDYVIPAIAGDEYANGSRLAIRVYPITGVTIESISFLIEGVERPFTQYAGYWGLSLSGLSDNNSVGEFTNIVVSGFNPDPEPDPEPTVFVVSQANLNQIGSYAKLFVNNVEAVVNLEVKFNDVVEVRSDFGYRFVTAVMNVSNGMGGFESIVFEMNPTLTAGTIIAGSEGEGSFPIIWGGAVTLSITVEAYTPEVSGTNRVYLVSREQFDELNAARFVDHLGNVIDYGAYILGLIELPNTVDAELFSGVENIQLGDLKTNIEAETLSTDKLSIDMGSISVPATNGDASDFMGVIVELHLPYAQSINVEPEYVIGQTISIEYLIDVYTGVATVNISSTKINSVFHTMEVDLNLTIPYIQTHKVNTNISNSNIKVGGDNRIYFPFIEVKRSELELPRGFFTIPIVDEGQLSGESGFITVDNIELEVAALSVEREMIINRLSSGVIIK